MIADTGATFILRLGNEVARTSVRPTPGAATHVASYDVSSQGIDALSLVLAKCGALWATYYGAPASKSVQLDTFDNSSIALGFKEAPLHLGPVRWRGFIRPPVSGVFTFSTSKGEVASVSIPLYAPGPTYRHRCTKCAF